MTVLERVCLLGFGEVGQALAADLAAAGTTSLSAYDIQFDCADSVPSDGLAALPSVRPGASAMDAVGHCELVVCAVTAAEDLNATRAFAAGLDQGSLVLDLNSVSPKVKREAAEIVESSGGRYVEAAVMGPIHPERIRTPMLLGGPHVKAAVPVLHELGFLGARGFASEIGRASATKMCRSVIVKGIEALLVESLLAARRYGVDETVLDSLDNLLPGTDWRELSRYMISRSLRHGERRAEEMREVASTVEETGVEPWMSRACEARQAWASAFGNAHEIDSLGEMLDAMLSGVKSELEGSKKC